MKMTYEESLVWIHSKLKFGIKPGLKRVEWLLDRLGNPQKNLAAVHVVGTNGKGSTVNYLQNIFSQAGYEVGTFTSPFITDFRERISVNGQMISKETLVDLVARIYPHVEALPLETDYEPATEFEIITVLMFLYFGQLHPVDIAFIEAGLGGLYDSTNVFEPLAVLCPSIGLDHQNILGESYHDIATQKIGVLTNQAPLIYATDLEEVVQVFEAKSSQQGADSYRLARDFQVVKTENGFDFKGLQDLSDLHLVMPGDHQQANASLAIQASLLLQKDFPKVDEAAIRQGLAMSRWQGRTEFVAERLMIDGAHNKESVAVLCDLLDSQYADQEVHILFAAIAGKPVDVMLEQLGRYSSLTVTSFDYPTSLQENDYGAGYTYTPDFKVWLAQAKEAKSGLYLVTGSLYFISQVRQHLLGEK